jgi:putative transposase
VASNVLDQNFMAEAPDCVWTMEGWLYLAIVVDLYSRNIVGWAMSGRMKRGLAMDALQRAITLRRPPPGLIHHSDRGSQYCCGDYRRLVAASGVIASMSGRENCCDNAMVETMFKTIKTGLVWRTAFKSWHQVSKAIGLYIEGFHNPRRRHSSLGDKSPAAFQTAIQATARTGQSALH